MYINRVGVGKPHGSLDVQVGAGADDGYWVDGYSIFDATDDTMTIGNSGYFHIFARWTGITIPAGVAIKAASVHMTLTNETGAVSGNRIYFNDAASPTAPTTYATANGKTKTTAYVTWNFGSYTQSVTSPDISEVIQELIDSHAPYVDGSMMMLLKAYTDADTRDILTYEYTGHLSGPTLHIEW